MIGGLRFQFAFLPIQSCILAVLMGNKKKSNLKSSLSRFQEKQHRDQLQKSKEAAKADKLKKSLQKSKAGTSSHHRTATVKPSSVKGSDQSHNRAAAIIPFKPTDSILLIGEGNFSFTRALFISDHPEIRHLPPANVTATAYDSEDVCYEKYPDARDIVADLRNRGVRVVFGVDAASVSTKKGFRGRKWRKIVWNFPHAGKQIADQDRNILSNQTLVLDFLKCAADLLQDGVIPSVQTRGRNLKRKRGTVKQGDTDTADESELEDDLTTERGTVLITLKNAPPYTLWDVPSLAKKPPITHVGSKQDAPQPRYVQLRSFKFVPEIWEGYSHRMTKGWVEGIYRGSGGGAEDRTWEFCLADSS